MKRFLAFAVLIIISISLLSCERTKPSGDETTESDSVALYPDPITTPDISDTSTEPSDSTEPVSDTEEPITAAPVDTTTSVPENTEPVITERVPGTELGSGYVISESGTKLNILLSWKAVEGQTPGTADITVRFFLDCYSIFVGERNDTEIRVGDRSVVFSTPQLELPGNGFNEIEFGSFTFTVDKASGSTTTLPIYGAWHFRGTYAGLSVDWVTVNSTFTFEN